MGRTNVDIVFGFSACAICVVILATKSLILFSSFAYLASQPARVRIASSSPFVEFYESHTHTLLTCLLERANNSVKRTDIPLSPSVTRLPQTSEYYRGSHD